MTSDHDWLIFNDASVVWCKCIELVALQVGENIAQLRGLLEYAEAVEKASTNGEVIKYLDEREKRSADEKTGGASDRHCRETLRR